MNYVVVGQPVEGLSIKIMADLLCTHLLEQGHSVDQVSDCKPNDLGKLADKVVICLSPPDLMQLLAGNTRYGVPKKIISVFSSNFEEMNETAKIAYLAAFSVKYPFPLVNVPHSEFTQKAMSKFAREVFTPSRVQAIAHATKLIKYGCEPTFTPSDKFMLHDDPETGPDAFRLIVPFNRVNQTQKNVNLNYEVTQAFTNWHWKKYCTGVPANFYYVKGFGPEDKGFVADPEVFQFLDQPKTRAEYRENITRHHAFLCTSNFESFGIYYLELLLSGLVGVFVDKPWIHTLLPGYPFVTKPENLTAMLMHVRENYAECRQKIINEVIPKIQKDYSLAQFHGELESLSKE